MQSNVPVAEATLDEMVFPDRVQDALGEVVGAAREGPLALSVSVGLGVLSELLEEEVTELVGPKGKWNPDRTAIRHGHEDGEVTLGGRRVEIGRVSRRLRGECPAQSRSMCRAGWRGPGRCAQWWLRPASRLRRDHRLFAKRLISVLPDGGAVARARAHHRAELGGLAAGDRVRVARQGQLARARPHHNRRRGMYH